MKISYNWLQSLFRGKLPDPEKIAELLTFHSVEVEGVERKGKDWALTLDVLPNRAHDLLSHRGVAREVAALTALQFYKPGSIKQKDGGQLKTNDVLTVRIKDPDLCSRYTTRVMRGVKVASSPGWLTRRLEVVGIRSINNVVDAANYVMMELGQPLHAFDFDKLTHKNRHKSEHKSTQIVVRRAKKGDTIITLDGEDRRLDDSTLVIADSEKPIAIAGIMGGRNTEVASTTKNLVLESANFDPITIRRSSRALGLRTESSLRFEYGLDPNLASEAVDRLAALIHGLAGGEIAQGRIDIYPKKVNPKKVLLDGAYAIRLLGSEISPRAIKDTLEQLGFGYEAGVPSGKILVTIPTFRQDISIEEDLIEEVGRVYGYERIPIRSPVLEVEVPLRESHHDYSRLIRELLPALGYSEVYNISFWGERFLARMGLEARDSVQLENPVNEDAAYLRSGILPLLLENVKSNLAYTSDIKLFELGKVYMKKEGKNGYREKEQIGFVATKKISAISPRGFYEIKGEVEWLFEGLGVPDVSFVNVSKRNSDATDSIWHPGNSVAVTHNGENLGILGEINPAILRNFRIKERVVAAVLDSEKIIARAARGDRYYEPPPRYPAVLRDIAVLVPLEVRVEEVLNVINREGGMLVKDIDLFDMYEGEELPEGQKNFAFHIVYQADDRTLTSKEVSGLHAKIVKAVEEEGWEARK